MRLHSHTEKTEAITQITKRSGKWLRSKYAGWTLAAISFAESVFAPILIDPFLVALIFAKRESWKYYVAISVTASVVGGVIAYILGAYFFETVGVPVLKAYGLESYFVTISESIDSNGFVFVLLGAFTPIPYKIVAIASGLLHINLLTFIVASTVGRIFRLGLVGYAAYAVGPRALPIIQRNLQLFAAIVGVILIVYILIQIFV